MVWIKRDENGPRIDPKLSVRVVTVPCPGCGEEHLVIMPLPAYRDWSLGHVPLQVAWPDGGVNERELLITGMCPPCWDAMPSFDEVG